MDKLTKKGLDGTQLKTIALVLMVLDHIHYFFEFTGCIPTVFSMLGRLSAPLFLFCTVEGLMPGKELAVTRLFVNFVQLFIQK